MKVKTLEEAVEHIFPRFEGIEEDESFKDGEDTFAAFCHSQLSGGIGMRIRNQLGLWEEDNELHQHLKNEHGCEHPDDMSDLIIRHVYRRIQNGDTPKMETEEVNEEQSLPTSWFKTHQIRTWIGEPLATEGKTTEELDGGHGTLIIMHQCGDDKEALKDQIRTFLDGLDNDFEGFAC